MTDKNIKKSFRSQGRKTKNTFVQKPKIKSSERAKIRRLGTGKN